MSDDQLYYYVPIKHYKERRELIISIKGTIIKPDYTKTIKNDREEMLIYIACISIFSLAIGFFVGAITTNIIIGLIAFSLGFSALFSLCFPKGNIFYPFVKNVYVLGEKVYTIVDQKEMLVVRDYAPEKLDSCLEAIQDYIETRSKEARDYVHNVVSLARNRKNIADDNSKLMTDSKWKIESNTIKQEIGIEREINNINSSL